MDELDEPGRVSINPVIIDDIAKLAHDVNAIYCRALGEEAVPWEQASELVKDSARQGVGAILSNRVSTPEQAHQCWYDYKKREGWQYGPEKNEAARTHPCLVPYEELSAAQRYKDEFFFTVVTNVGTALSVYYPLR